MTKRGSADVAYFLIDGLNVLGTVTEFSDQLEAVTEETTPLGVSWAEHAFVGVRRGEISQEGFYDDAAGSAHDALASGPGISRVISYSLGGTNFVGYTGAMQVNYERLAKREELTKARATYKSNGAIEAAMGGIGLWGYAAVGSTGRKTGVNAGASSTGAIGYLHYNASSGEANIRIMHSSDDITYATLFTFTKTASGHAAERLVTTGVIEKWTAADFTTASATGAIGALNAFVGITRVAS